LLNAAVVHNGQPVGNGQRFFLVVRDKNRGQAKPLLQRPDFFAHLDPQFGIQIRQWFVEQKHLGLNRQRPRNRDPLLLTAGKLARITVGIRIQTHHVERLLDAHRAFGFRHLVHFQTKRDILGNRHVRKQGIALEYHARIAFVRWYPGHILAADLDGTGSRFDEAGHHAQRRRLAAAAGTEKCHHLAVFDIERKVGHRHRCTELLLQIPDGNFGHFYTT